MTTADALAVITRWAHCRCSPQRAPTAPCSCSNDYSLSAVYNYARELDLREKRDASPAARAARRKKK